MSNRKIMITGLFVASVGCFFVGPSFVFQLSESLGFVTVGILILGADSSILMIFNIQEMSSVADLIFDNLSNK
jgi:hypothetical protein